MKPLQILARRMFPAFVAEEYPQMLAFTERVFEYMDKEGNQYNVVSNLLSYNDVDTTLAKFESVFRNQYLANFPDVLAADVNLLVKNIRSFYLNKGTEQSYRFLFGALFDSTVNFKYPKKNILRTSDGLWFTPQYLVITDGNDNIPPQLPDTTAYPVFKLIDKFITGTESGAVAFVDDSFTLGSVGSSFGGNPTVECISTVESEGAFIPGEQILIGNTIVQNGSFDQDLAFWDIFPATDRGFSTVNNQLVIEQLFGNLKTRYISQTIDVNEGDQFWLRFTLTAANAAETRITMGYAPGGIELYDSGEIGLNTLPFSDTVSIDPVAPGKTTVTITIWNTMALAADTCIWDGISLVEKDFLTNVPVLFIANKAIESFTDLIFVDSNPDTITSAIGDFTLLLTAAQTFQITGSPANDGSYLINSVTSNTITLDGAETLVAEGPLAADLSVIESGVIQGTSKWKDIRGFLSEGDFTNDREIVLQDGNYYQDFSYEVKSQISIDRFESIVKDLLHPAGFKMFSAVVAADGLVVYAFRESYYNDLVLSNDGGSGNDQALITRTTSGKPFNELFRTNDIVSFGEDGVDGVGSNEGWYIVDTVDTTTLVLRQGFSLTAKNYAGTEIKIWSGIGIIDMPDVEFLNKDIEDPLNVLEYYYSTIEMTDSTTLIRDVADGKPFDEWIAVDQYFECGREFDPLHRRRFKVLAVTPTTITIDSVSNFSSKILNETVSAYSKSYDGALVRLKRGLTLHTPGTYMNVEFGVDFEYKHGFGVTWEVTEKKREIDQRTVAEWSGLFVNDFLVKATERFGFINQWEIDVEPPPSSNDPNIVWDFFNPGYVESLWINSSAISLLYFYEGSNLMEGPFPSAASMNYEQDATFHQQVIHDDATPFSPGEYLVKWEKDTLYSGDWANFTIDFDTGADGVWYDLWRQDVRIESDNSPADGVQHVRVKVYVATDDGFGAPVAGSDTWKYVTFYSLGTNGHFEVRDTFAGTNGTLLPAHTPDTDVVGGGWIAVAGGLEILTNNIIGNTAGKNSAVLDSGQSVGEFKLEGDITTADNFGLFIRTDATAANGYELEIDQSGAEPILKLWQLDAGTPTLRDSIEMTGATFNGWNQLVKLTADGDDLIYGEFYEDVGQNPQMYSVEWTDVTHTTLTHCGFSLDNLTNQIDQCWFEDTYAHAIPRFLPHPTAP